MGKIILVIIETVIVLLGVICIFDARIITKKMFSFGDQNEGSMGLKIVGFFISMIGAFLLFYTL